jgi:hypothetical protein
LTHLAAGGKCLSAANQSVMIESTFVQLLVEDSDLFCKQLTKWVDGISNWEKGGAISYAGALWFWV